MGKDLFGNTIIDEAEEELKNYDSGSFNERLMRLKFINKIFPFGQREYGSDESVIIFNECVHCYIFGQFISTIILAQAFIERRFQEYFHLRTDNRYKYNLNRLLKEFKAKGLIDDILINKINKLRLKRNPFIHLRDPNHEDSLLNRSFLSNKNVKDQMKEDAKDALSVMLIISQMRVL